MRRLVQTDTEHGNCWQTAWACVLDVDPDVLPDQVLVEGPGRKRGSYHNALHAFFREHHGAAVVQIQRHALGGISVRSMDGYHLVHGLTVRTERNGMTHVVVAKDGVVVWDPHPSGAGLISTNAWELLAPLPQDMIDQWRKERDTLLSGTDVAGAVDCHVCACPACGPEGLEIARRVREETLRRSP
jgi:hypothetical protein